MGASHYSLVMSIPKDYQSNQSNAADTLEVNELCNTLQTNLLCAVIYDWERPLAGSDILLPSSIHFVVGHISLKPVLLFSVLSSNYEVSSQIASSPNVFYKYNLSVWNPIENSNVMLKGHSSSVAGMANVSFVCLKSIRIRPPLEQCSIAIRHSSKIALSAELDFRVTYQRNSLFLMILKCHFGDKPLKFGNTYITLFSTSCD